MEAFPLQWPIGWPRTKLLVSSRFGKGMYNKPTIALSRDFLFDELKRLGASRIVLSTNLELRNDGLPYSNQKNPVDRGVAVYFVREKQDMVIACDNFDNIGCNIHAIAKTVEAMRGIDRWGCSELMSRAFTGFKALPENGTITNTSWWEVLGLKSPDISQEEIKSAYRELIKTHHPDKGGSSEFFIRIQKAYEESQTAVTA